MNSQTSAKSVWNIIKKGKDTSNTVHHLSVNDRDVTSHCDIANTLADTFFRSSSSAFSTDAFTSIHKKAEKQTINFSSDDAEESTNSIHHLSVSDRDVTSHRDIANALADNFSYNSSSAFSTDAFTSVRCKAEKQNINISSQNAEVYNRPFSMEE